MSSEITMAIPPNIHNMIVPSRLDCSHHTQFLRKNQSPLASIFFLIARDFIDGVQGLLSVSCRVSGRETR